MKWPMVNLPDICRPRQWKTLSKKEMSIEGYPVYGANGRIGFSDTFTHEKPVILIGCRGTCGSVHITKPKSYANGNAMALDDLDERRVSLEFLATVLKGADFSKVITGVAQPQITGQSLARFEIPLPPLAEQKRIAAILDAADALRVRRRKALAQLDALLQSTFLTLFGDPLTNPKGWEKSAIGELVDNIDSGWSPTCLERPAADGEWGVLKLGAVTYCVYREDQTKALPPGLTPRPEIEVQTGDLLFARKNTYELVAACAYVHKTRSRLMLPDLIFRLRISKAAKTEPIFMWQQLIVPHLRKHIQSFAGGAAGSMPNISKAKLRDIQVIRPPLLLQQKFAAIVESTERQKATQRAHLFELDALYAALQHRAFRGEL